MFRTYQNGQKKFTKIVATISGSGCTAELIEKLYRRGMDVVRLNTAHATIEEVEKAVACVRSVSPQIAVMIDTKGPNIRTCNVAGSGIILKQGEILRISGNPDAKSDLMVNYVPFADEVPAGSRIVCDDGAAAFRVKGKENGCLLAEVLFDCTVCNKKSVNVPDVALKAPALTEKDREFLKAAVQFHCDLIAHSFVRSAADIEEVRRALGEAGREIGIIAKIENREGVRNIKEILKVADGIMVARGDLGIEIPIEEVPAIQKQLIYESRIAGKPVITATQMLQSMENAPSPTRAEVSDVANAVYDGTDAVMLSGETAHGRFPCEAVEMMCRIVIEAEKAPEQFFTQLSGIPDGDKDAAYLLAAAIKAADVLPVKAILCGTLNGQSARVCAALRSKIPVYASTPSEISMRKLALSYGIYPVLAHYQSTPLDQFKEQIPLLTDKSTGLTPDDLIIVLSKHSEYVKRNNLLCVTAIKELL